MTTPTATTAVPDAVIDALQGARRVLVLSGAGMSAESGVPTFRDAQTGLWEAFDPTQLATLEAFQMDPPFVWASGTRGGCSSWARSTPTPATSRSPRWPGCVR
ncbi:Sir2 family NAD-dependent protein deacetylase [Janibacter limosus]|uniref:Sir2 family NAD-dependent protein deacetylase n=1 Tax=Janibacter limosus TaxID=53458 RepID=UPI002152040B|nr:Sir2 family NAD-dependent protein deacetylase [Janibacter limosus]WKV16472.1 Sir2 family NAD-dependent protein deacetylase [Janibacter limosus]